MKYITYVVITALMFGMAFAPSIHDELAFAQTGEGNQTSMENKGTSIDKKEIMQEKKKISVEKKQVSQDKKEMTIEKKKISKEKQSTNFQESKSRLLERYSTLPEPRKPSTRAPRSRRYRRRYSNDRWRVPARAHGSRSGGVGSATCVRETRKRSPGPSCGSARRAPCVGPPEKP